MTKLKNFLAKQSVGFYAGIVSVIFMLIGTIMLANNCSYSYYDDYTSSVPLLGSLAIIVAVALLVARQFVKTTNLELVWLVVIILMTAALMIMMSMRVESMAYIWGSDLEAGNTEAISALDNFVASAIVAFIGIAAAIVASFSDITRNAAAKQLQAA